VVVLVLPLRVRAATEQHQHLGATPPQAAVVVVSLATMAEQVALVVVLVG
jgi:hypothetical protein